MAILRIERGAQVGTTYFLEKDKETTIGRDASQATIAIEDQKASRVHAKITCENGQYYIEDLKSRNGTLKNGKPVLEKQILTPGDFIHIGFTYFSFGREIEIEKISHELPSYEIIQEIKQSGTIGLVLKAKQLGLARIVTLNLLPPNIIQTNPELKSSFRQQVRALARLNHENISTILDFEAKDPKESKDSSYLYFTTEYLEGSETLSNILLNQGKLPIERSLEIAIAVASGLAHAHKQQVLHLDVTPSNITIYGRRIILGGFGMATVLADMQDNFSLGKAEYLSPEQILKNPATQSTDIYAIGILLYELLAGTPPFTSKNPEELGDIIVNESPRSVTYYNSDIPAKIEDLIYQCLEKDPKDRPSSCEEVAKRLKDILIRIRLANLKNSSDIYVSPVGYWIVEIVQHPLFAWLVFPILSIIFLLILRAFMKGS